MFVKVFVNVCVIFDTFPRAMSGRLFIFACSFSFSAFSFSSMLLPYTRMYVLVFWGFVGACVFRSSSSDARDPVVVVVCLCGFV